MVDYLRNITQDQNLNVKNYDEIQETYDIPKNVDFYLYFGKVMIQIVQYFKHEIKWYQKITAHRAPIPKYFDETNQIICDLIPEWKTLLSYSEGRICYHVFKMLFLILQDPHFNELNKYDKNVILWAALLHDISKRGKPVLIGKDYIHPFKSGWQTLKIFRNSFKFVEISDEDMKQWDIVFEDLYIKDNKTDDIIQDHSKIRIVKIFIDEHIKNEFLRDVFWLVFLHQSLPTIEEHVAKSLLCPLESEVKVYFSKRLMEIMGIILRNDSLSYLLYSPKWTKKRFMNEINDNVAKMLKFLEK